MKFENSINIFSFDFSIILRHCPRYSLWNRYSTWRYGYRCQNDWKLDQI